MRHLSLSKIVRVGLLVMERKFQYGMRDGSHAWRGLENQSQIFVPNSIINDLQNSEGKCDEIKISSCFDDFQDKEDIVKIYIPQNKREDRRIWPFPKEGQLTIKSVYKVLSTQTEIANNNGIDVRWKAF